MAEPKIISVNELAAKGHACRMAGRVLVFTNGCFDLLHVGHVRYLQAARQRGDCLAVAVNSDNSVRSLKGLGRPVNPEHDRMEVLAALECVDYVVLFDSLRVTSVINAVAPQLYVKGGDYTVDDLDSGEREALNAVGARIEILQLVPGKSTTAVIHKLAAASASPV